MLTGCEDHVFIITYILNIFLQYILSYTTSVFNFEIIRWSVFMNMWFMILGLSFRNCSLTWSCKDIHLYFFSNSFKTLFFLFRSLFYLVVCRVWGTDINFCPLSEKPFLSTSCSLECQRQIFLISRLYAVWIWYLYS